MPLFANKYSPWAHFPVPASPHFFLKHIQTYLIWWWCTWSRSLVMNQKWWWWGGKLCWGKQSRPGLVWGLIVKLSGRASRSQILDGSVPNTTSVRPCNYAHFGHHQLLQYCYNHSVLWCLVHKIAIANTNTNTITSTTQARLVIVHH